MPERESGGLGGDLFSVGIQVALAVGIPLVVAAVGGNALDQRLGTSPWVLLTLVLLGLVVAAVGVFVVIRNYIAEHPDRPPTEGARAAGRRWQAELDEKERRREAGEDE